MSRFACCPSGCYKYVGKANPRPRPAGAIGAARLDGPELSQPFNRSVGVGVGAAWPLVPPPDLKLVLQGGRQVPTTPSGPHRLLHDTRMAVVDPQGTLERRGSE